MFMLGMCYFSSHSTYQTFTVTTPTKIPMITDEIINTLQYQTFWQGSKKNVVLNQRHHLVFNLNNT